MLQQFQSFNFNEATLTQLGKFNEGALQSLTGLSMQSLPAHAPAKLHDMQAIWVSEMPKRLPLGWSVGMRWLEALFNEETDKAIIEGWRPTFESGTGVLFTEDQKPDPHLTVIFGHNPSNHYVKKAIVETMPRKPFRFTCVKALGPAGKENCYVAYTNDRNILKWMTLIRNNNWINSNHAEYDAEYAGWPVAGGDFGSLCGESGGPVIPHAMLMRGLNLTPSDVALPPSLGTLADIEVTLIGMVEWVTIILDGVKIKLATYYPPI